ncbi:O-acetylserine/cysteine efflux transporter [Variovorax boronicumulans]|uniref:EamA family transporter n=1 Tax=Variovorax boronicumulans TaxID=436515 RepID=UPI003394F8DB
MRPFHMLLAVLVAVIWGVAFVVSKIGLESFTPPQLAALRFLVAAVGVLWLPRPTVSWKAVVFIGLTVFTGQFLLQFFGIAFGMPAGLTAFVVQTQALFTVGFAALIFGDRPSTQQITGIVVALSGLLVIGMTLNGNVPVLAFALTLASALSWAVGNLVIKRLPKVDMLHLMVWASLVPPVPALALSFVQDGPGALWWAVMHASMWGLVAPVYLGLLATVLAYAIWGNLLQRYPTATVAPFALLAPAVGLSMSSLVYGESFGIIRLLGMVLLLVGVAIAAGRLNRWLRLNTG